MTKSGVETGAQVGLQCPACSPHEEQVHEVLSTGGHETVRCRTCDHVHKVQLGDGSTVRVRTVISFGEESERTSVSVPTDEVLAIGEEFVADCDDGPVGVRITSLERPDGTRTSSSKSTDIGTIWARAIDNVAVRATIHPGDGSHDGTVSETYYLPGDETLTVGESIPHLDEAVTIEGLVLREDAVAHDRAKLQAHGDTASAKDVKRLYAQQKQTDDWTSAWG